MVDPFTAAALLKLATSGIRALRPREQPFQYERDPRIDEEIDRLGGMDRRGVLADPVTRRAGIALLLTLLGTLGLTVHAANRRVREIGIRKVLGASLAQVISLMTREVLLLILVSSAVAVPVAFWLADQWLGKFAFRTGFPFWSIPAALLFTLVLTGLSAGAVGWRAATSNPTDSLRSE